MIPLRTQQKHGNEGPELGVLSFPFLPLRFHPQHLCVFHGNEASGLETELETKGSNWKRTGNEGPKVETSRKRLLTLHGNEAPQNTPLRFHARSFVSNGNTPGAEIETKLTDSLPQDQIPPFWATPLSRQFRRRSPGHLATT